MAESCYRHPDRETNVSCSNCGRPICTDCMHNSPVGMRCPECAAERTRVHTGVGSGFGSAAIRATYALIALNVIVFVAELGAGGGAGSLEGGGSLIVDGGLCGPAVADGGFCSGGLFAGGEWWRIFTSGFLHAGPLHLLLNMFVLYILGTLIEPAIGTARIVGLYVVSLVGGAFGALLLSPDALTVGASGAVYGLMAAAILIARHRGIGQVAGQIGIWLVLNLVFTFSVPGISIGGHLGGLLAGGVAAWGLNQLEHSRLPNRHLVEAGLLVGLGALCFAASLWAATQGNGGTFTPL